MIRAVPIYIYIYILQMHMGAQRIQYSSSAGASCTTYVGQLPVLELSSSLSALGADLRAQCTLRGVLSKLARIACPAFHEGLSNYLSRGPSSTHLGFSCPEVC